MQQSYPIEAAIGASTGARTSVYLLGSGRRSDNLRVHAQNIEHELRLDAFAHVQQLGMAYFEDRGIYASLWRVQTDARSG
ncbi:MAG: hypothetical protein ACE5FI_04010, partial [Anaerolineales bacterium]